MVLCGYVVRKILQEDETIPNLFSPSEALLTSGSSESEGTSTDTCSSHGRVPLSVNLTQSF